MWLLFGSEFQLNRSRQPWVIIDSRFSPARFRLRQETNDKEGLTAVIEPTVVEYIANGRVADFVVIEIGSDCFINDST